MIKTPFTKMRVGFRKPVQAHAEDWASHIKGPFPRVRDYYWNPERMTVWRGPGQELGPSEDRCTQPWGPRKEAGGQGWEVVQIPRRHFPLAPQIASPWMDRTGS